MKPVETVEATKAIAAVAIGKIDKGPRWRERLTDEEIDAMAVTLVLLGVAPVEPGPLPDEIRGKEAKARNRG